LDISYQSDLKAILICAKFCSRRMSFGILKKTVPARSRSFYAGYILLYDSHDQDDNVPHTAS
jgi:hypothetical protein